MLADGLIEMPPESNVIPLPTNATCLSVLGFPLTKKNYKITVQMFLLQNIYFLNVLIT